MFGDNDFAGLLRQNLYPQSFVECLTLDKRYIYSTWVGLAFFVNFFLFGWMKLSLSAKKKMYYKLSISSKLSASLYRPQFLTLLLLVLDYRVCYDLSYISQCICLWCWWSNSTNVKPNKFTQFDNISSKIKWCGLDSGALFILPIQNMKLEISIYTYI